MDSHICIENFANFRRRLAKLYLPRNKRDAENGQVRIVTKKNGWVVNNSIYSA